MRQNCYTLREFHSCYFVDIPQCQRIHFVGPGLCSEWKFMASWNAWWDIKIIIDECRHDYIFFFV
jgi:hypothetical protein